MPARHKFPVISSADQFSRSVVLCLAALLCLNASVIAQRPAAPPATQNAEQLYAQGVALLQKGDFVRAAASFRSALRLKPDFAEAHNALGLALGQQGQLDAAINSFREAVRLRADFAE